MSRGSGQVNAASAQAAPEAAKTQSGIIPLKDLGNGAYLSRHGDEIFVAQSSNGKLAREVRRDRSNQSDSARARFMLSYDGCKATHSNVLSTLWAHRDSSGTVFMATEYANAGAITPLLPFFPDRFVFDAAKSVIKQLVEGVVYQYRVVGVLPRFLTTNDVFLREDGAVKVGPYFDNKAFIEEVCDYFVRLKSHMEIKEWRRLRSDFVNFYVDSIFTPPEFVSQEGVLDLNRFADAASNDASAVWQIGVITMSILLSYMYHKTEFEKNNLKRQASHFDDGGKELLFNIVASLISRPSQLKGVEDYLNWLIPDSELRDLLTMCLQEDPRKRASLEVVYDKVLSMYRVNSASAAAEKVLEVTKNPDFLISLLGPEQLREVLLTRLYLLSRKSEALCQSYEAWKKNKLSRVEEKIAGRDVATKHPEILCLLVEFEARFVNPDSEILDSIYERLDCHLTDINVLNVVRQTVALDEGLTNRLVSVTTVLEALKKLPLTINKEYLCVAKMARESKFHSIQHEVENLLKDYVQVFQQDDAHTVKIAIMLAEFNSAFTDAAGPVCSEDIMNRYYDFLTELQCAKDILNLDGSNQNDVLTSLNVRKNDFYTALNGVIFTASLNGLQALIGKHVKVLAAGAGELIDNFILPLLEKSITQLIFDISREVQRKNSRYLTSALLQSVGMMGGAAAAILSRESSMDDSSLGQAGLDDGSGIKPYDPLKDVGN